MSGERCDVRFYGRVQGVGFRMTACHAASRHPELTGWVRNEPDGTVRMVMEGAPDKIRLCLEDLRSRMARNISHDDERWSRATGEFDSFGVRH